jgi:hypothetical protein
MDSPINKILLDDVFWEGVVNSLQSIAVSIAWIKGGNVILSDVHFTVATSRGYCSSEMHQIA